MEKEMTPPSNTQEKDKREDLKEEEVKEIEEFGKTTLKLKHTWVIWEQWDVNYSNTKTRQTYEDSVQSIGSFDNLVSFWQLWNNLPYSDPNKIFFDPDEGKERK